LQTSNEFHIQILILYLNIYFSEIQPLKNPIACIVTHVNVIFISFFQLSASKAYVNTSGYASYLNF